MAAYSECWGISSVVAPPVAGWLLEMQGHGVGLWPLLTTLWLATSRLKPGQPVSETEVETCNPCDVLIGYASANNHTTKVQDSTTAIVELPMLFRLVISIALVSKIGIPSWASRLLSSCAQQSKGYDLESLTVKDGNPDKYVK